VKTNTNFRNNCGAESSTRDDFARSYFEVRRASKAASSLVGRVALHSSGYELHFDDQLRSSLIEALDCNFNDSYTFPVVDGQIEDKKGNPFIHMINSCSRLANHRYESNPDMGFYLKRVGAEKSEAVQQGILVNGMLSGNTIMTTSPMTYELSGKPELLKLAGQRPERGRSIIRFSHWNGSDLEVSSVSLDFSSLDEIWQIIFEVTGIELDRTNSQTMLEDRRLLSLTREQVAEIRKKISDRQKDLNPLERRGGMSILKYESEPLIEKTLLRRARDLSDSCRTWEEFDERICRLIYDFKFMLDEEDDNLHFTKDGPLTPEIILEYSGSAGSAAYESGYEIDMCGRRYGSSEQVLISQGTHIDVLKEYSLKPINCPSCKKDVIVPDAALKANVLHCIECDNMAGICGDEKAVSDYKKSLPTKLIKKQILESKEKEDKNSPGSESIWAMLGLDVEKYEREKAEKLRKSKLKTESSGKVTFALAA
jgi:hypothetical protein